MLHLKLYVKETGIMKKFAKQIICILLILIAALQLIACEKQEPEVLEEPQETFTAQLGETNSTMFFDFSINSANAVDYYGDYVVDKDEYKLILAEITYTNTSSGAITIKDSDFVLGYGENNAQKAYCYDAFSTEMIPSEEALATADTKTYTMLFAVPVDETELTISYTELYKSTGQNEQDSTESQGDTFNVLFTV